MQQIVDLQDHAEFQELNVAFLSIAVDSVEELASGARQYGTDIPLLTDADRRVAASYGVLRWAVATGEPGHTFVLVDEDGTIAWLRDYGAPENGGSMYVPVNELTQQIEEHLTE
ncbi:MAG: redoxin domain-containing protein [Anaerolineaceae bacterium]|nr:MAG: redoxin domain-containing protein [Anaerolineaceae bacterium]